MVSRLSKLFVLLVVFFGLQVQILGKEIDTVDFDVPMTSFYENGLGKNIRVFGSADQVYAVHAILLDGLQRLVRLNPSFIRPLTKRLKSWKVEIHAEMDEEVSKVIFELGGPAGVAITRTSIKQKTSRIYPGRSGFSRSLTSIGNLLLAKVSAQEYVSILETEGTHDMIFWNPFAMVPLTLFHEFLHAMDFSSQTLADHNAQKTNLLNDLVLSCSFGVLGFAPMLSFNFEPVISAACMACKMAIPKKFYKDGEKLSYAIPEFSTPPDVNFGNLCGNNADKVMLDLFTRHSSGLFKVE